jgi:hypothetical protein
MEKEILDLNKEWEQLIKDKVDFEIKKKNFLEEKKRYDVSQASSENV